MLQMTTTKCSFSSCPLAVVFAAIFNTRAAEVPLEINSGGGGD
jgi:hypothetical protein